MMNLQEQLDTLLSTKNITYKITESEVKFELNEWASEKTFPINIEDQDKTLELMSNYLNDCYIEQNEVKEKMESLNRKHGKKVSISINDEEVCLSCDEWIDESLFFVDSECPRDILNEIENFFSINYIPHCGCYNEDLIEILVNDPRFNFIGILRDVDILSEENDTKIYYDISTCSDELIRQLNTYSKEDVDANEMHLTSLKIYNAFSLINNDSKERTQKNILGLAKSILFEISYKTGVALSILDWFFDPNEDNDIDGLVWETEESLEKLSDQTLDTIYDLDLIDYYYRAQCMVTSEFKYLAYYQILECLFDEVYQFETIQDLKQILNSAWFSSKNDENIYQLIQIVERYQKNKNDREKLKLVLQKYFKTNTHTDVYLLANTEISNILINKLNLMKNEQDLTDLNVITNAIYDYRCNCTHSNRKFTFRTDFLKTKEEMSYYIDLIKKVTERVIKNYG